MLAAILTFLVAGALAWRQATHLDRLSGREHGSSGFADEQHAWGIVLGALIAALGAMTVLQISLVEQLQSLGR